MEGRGTGRELNSRESVCLDTQQRKTTGQQDFLGRDAAERWGNTRITLSKQSFHPNVREVTWQAATADN